MKTNVLYISYDGMTDPLGQSQVLPYLRSLSQKGYSFTILSFEKNNTYQKFGAEIELSIKNFDIKWVPLPYSNKLPVISALKDLKRGRKEIKKILSDKDHQLVHCRGYIASLLGTYCKKKYGTKFLFDMRGWWADEKLESGAWNTVFFKPVYRYFKRKEKDFFSLSDHAISLTQAGKKYIIDNDLKNEKDISVIPTCVDLTNFRSFDENIRAKIRAQLSIPPEAPVLIYNGSLGGNYKNYPVFELFKTQIERDPNSILLLLTATDKDHVTSEIKKYNIPLGKVIIKNCRFAEMSDHLMAGDAGLIFYQEHFSAIGRSPTKLGEYWASGLPVISTAGTGDLKMLKEKYPESLFLLKDDSISEYKKALEFVFSISATGKTQLRKNAVHEFDLNEGVKKYNEIYNELLSRQPG